MMDKQQILSYLLDQGQREFFYTNCGYICALVKCRYDGDTDFLYMLYTYNQESPMRIGDKADYAGFISYKTGSVYDACYELEKVLGKSEDYSTILKRMVADISCAVKLLVDGKPVPVPEESEKIWNEDKNRTDHMQHHALAEARRRFFKREALVQYEPCIQYERTSTENIIRFINDHDAYVASEAQDYVARQARHINYHLWALEETHKQYDLMESTPGEHHLYRAIAESLSGEEKKVTLHLVKDGKTFEGKIETGTLLRSEGSHYSDYCLDAADRRRFVALFGNRAYISADDIQSITYGKKTLYERA